MDTTAVGCYKNTIRLRSGVYFDLVDPTGPIDVADIAGALAKLCRFGGQCQRFYSVAEHSVLCAWQAYTDKQPLDVCRAVLFHDATEAFCGDVVRPLKVLLSEYKTIEKRVEVAISKALNIDFDTNSGVIREIDNAMLFAERGQLFEDDGVVWIGQDEARKLTPILGYWEPERAESEFLMAARELTA
jgi:hypothetical protein